MMAAVLSRHQTKADGRCMMCLSPTVCQFKDQQFYGGVCLRTTVAVEAMKFVIETYPYCAAGHWPAGKTMWDQPNELTEAFNIVSNTLANINGSK